MLVETATVANVVASIILLIYTKRKHGFWDAAQIAFVVGAVAGAALMFSNGAYYLITQGQDLTGSDGNPYREIAPDGFLQSAFFCFSTSIVPYVVLNTWPLQLVFALCAYFSWKNSHIGVPRKVHAAKNEESNVVFAIAIILLIICVYGIFYSNFAPKELPFLLKCSNALIGCVWIIALLAWCVIYWKKGERRMLFAFLYALALCLPLLIVSQYGPRCYLPTYFMLCLLATLLVQRIFMCSKHSNKRISELIPLFAHVFAAVLIIVWLIIYLPIGLASFERDAYVKQAKESQAQEIVISSLNANGNVWRADPTSDMLKNWYKKFYGLDKDIKITIQE